MYQHEMKDGKLMIGGVLAEELVAQYGSPLYVYNENIIRQRYTSLNNAILYKNKRIHYAMKANSNIHILKILLEEGSYIDAVSPGEIKIALKAGFKPEKILFTGINFTSEDINFAVENKVMLNIDSLYALKICGENYPGAKISIRVNPDIGAGHHQHVITGGRDSKFGIFQSDIDEAKEIIAKYELQLAGIHSHIGSGILEERKFMEVMNIILPLASNFKGLDFIDFGGGIGVAYHPGEEDFNLELWGKEASKLMEDFSKKYKKKVTLKIEPGRFLVAEAGVFLTTITGIKETPKFIFVGVDSGSNQLARPMAYGSYHHVVNASNMNGSQKGAVVAGYICESGDVFTRNSDGPVARAIADPRPGNILAILTAGAYGFSMSSQYNSRFRPAEVLAYNGVSRLIRRRETIEDILYTME